MAGEGNRKMERVKRSFFVRFQESNVAERRMRLANESIKNSTRKIDELIAHLNGDEEWFLCIKKVMDEGIEKVAKCKTGI